MGGLNCLKKGADVIVKTYEVEIVETVRKTTFIKAENESEALKIARKTYDNGDIVVEEDYLLDLEFDVLGEFRE